MLVSAGLFDRFVASVVELFDLEGREVVDGAVGAFGVEPRFTQEVAVGGQTYLALSSEPIEIPNPLAPLLKRLVTIAERNPQAIRGESSAP